MNNQRYVTLAIGLLLLVGCDRSEWNLPKTKAPEQTSPAPAADRDNTSKGAFLKSTREELDRVKQDLDVLKEKAKTASEAVKEKTVSEVENFQEQQQALEAKWSNLQQEGSTSWKEVEKPLRDAIENLRASIRGVATKEGA